MKKLLAGAPKYRNEGAPRLPAHPMRMCICGATDTGKTYWLAKLLLDKEMPWDRVIWVAPEDSLQQPVVQSLRESFTDDKAEPDDPLRERFETVPGIDTAEAQERLEALIAEGAAAGWQQAIVFDDLSDAGGKDKKISNLFTSGRHRNCSVIELTQQVFTAGTRQHRLNTDWFVCLPFSDARETGMLFQQLCPRDWRKVQAAYIDCTRNHGKGHPFIIDQPSGRSDVPENRVLRFRAGDFDNVYAELRDAQ